MDNLTYGIYTNITKTEKQNKQGKYLWSGICTVCGKEVYKELSVFKKCCKQCQHQKIHKINNYIGIYMPEHHLAGKSGCVYEHCLTAEKMLGRELKKVKQYIIRIEIVPIMTLVILWYLKLTQTIVDFIKPILLY